MSNLKYCISICCCILLLLFVACRKEPQETELDPPEMLSSSPANGENMVAVGKLNVVLTFSQNIFCPSAGHSSITVDNDAIVTNVSFSSNNLTIVLDSLKKSTTYTVTVAKDVVIGPTHVGADVIKISFSTIDTQNITSNLVVQNPSSEVVTLYNYLKNNYKSKIISGTMARVDWNIQEAELVYQATGKYPAMNTFDYIFLYASPSNWIDYSNTAVVENWWNDGGIVSACWHWNVPRYQGADVTQSNNVTFRPDSTTFHPANALVAGTWENTVMKADLAKIAGYLKLLKNKNIPIIWRPLHEAAGNIYTYPNGQAWFWWGRDGATAFVGLWRYMFNYFQQEGLNNLIWVWTSEVNDDDFYPGDEYVDIIGRDLYNQSSSAVSAQQFDILATKYPSKIITLSEMGNVSTIGDAWNSGAYWSYFMPWYDPDHDTNNLDNHIHATTQWWQNAMQQEVVLSRDELPNFVNKNSAIFR